MLVELITQKTGGQIVIDARQITTVTAIELGCRVNIGPFYSVDVVEQPERVRVMWQAALRSDRVAQFAVAIASNSDYHVTDAWTLAAKLADAEPPANP